MGLLLWLLRRESIIPNDAKGAELGWVCITLAVESYGCWGTEGAFLFSKSLFAVLRHMQIQRKTFLVCVIIQ